MKKDNKQTKQAKDKFEQLKEHLSNYGLQVTNSSDGSIVVADKEGNLWRPIKSQSEYFCAAWDNEPMLNIPGAKIPFIRADYKS